MNKCNQVRRVDQLLALLITKGQGTPVRLAKLIENYCSISCADQAYLLFQHFDHPNLLLFNTLIRCNPPHTSIRLFARGASDSRIILDEFSYIYGFGACARLRSLSSLCFGRQLHGSILKHGHRLDLQIGTTLIHFYGSTGRVDLGRQAFDEMPERNIITWNAMISGYCSHGVKEKQFIWDAIMLYKEMLAVDGLEMPNRTTMVCVLSASTQLSVIELGSCVHCCIEKIIYMPEGDVYIGTALVDMYSKCGFLANALAVFDRMTSRNVLTWTAMATGFALHGQGEAALGFLDSMVQNRIMPNALTFTSVLSACCHSGLIKEGIHLFHHMSTKFSVERAIQHYGCVVNLLCKAGLLREAYQTIMEMEEKPDAVLWRILLNACKSHGDATLGEKVGEILLKLQPHKASAKADDPSEDYIALSNVFASAGKWQEVERVRHEMQVKMIHVKPGASFC